MSQSISFLRGFRPVGRYVAVSPHRASAIAMRDQVGSSAAMRARRIALSRGLPIKVIYRAG
jgi:hypothetical protein